MYTLNFCAQCTGSFPLDAKYCPTCGIFIDRSVFSEADCCGEHYKVFGLMTAYCMNCGKPLALLKNDRNLPGARVGVES